MAFSPKVSIVIPVYNGSNFLAEAIDSALAQTYKNIEIVVINDGSKDEGKTAAIARSYGKKIRYYEKENGGVATALSLGVKKMEGEYFSWLSHDDLYTPNKVEDQINFLRDNPEEQGSILYGDFSLIEENGTLIREIRVPSIPPSRFVLALISSSPVHGCTTLVPKVCFDIAGTFDANLRTTQDYDLWFRMAYEFRFVPVSSNGVLSRQHEKQDSKVLSPLMARESVALYMKFLHAVETDPRFWDKTAVKSIAYREMAYGLLAKQCFGPARYAFSLYRKETGFSLRVPFEQVMFGAIIKAASISWSSQLRALYRRLFARKLIKPSVGTRKILIITPAITPIPGGLSEQSTLLAETFCKSGYAVDVITEQMQPNLPLEETVGGIHIHRLRQPRKRNMLGLFILSTRLGWLLIRSSKKYDLCVIRTITSQALVAGFLKACGLVRINTVITAETGGEDDEIRSLARRPFSRLIVHFLNKNNYINSNNSANYQHYLELGFTEAKLTKIYNGVLVDDYANATYPKKVESFIFLAELNREKGVHELLDAFKIVQASHPRAQLFIGGYGKEESYIKNFITKNKLSSNMHFSGYIQKAEKKTFFNKGDCFVFPSYSEGFGLVVAEAVVHKRAVISTDVADLRDIYGSTIQFCKTKDVKDLAASMKKMIEGFRPAALNYDKVLEKLSIQRTVREFLELR